MKFKDLCSSALLLFKKTFLYPASYKEILADKNIRRIHFILIIPFLFCVCGFIVFLKSGTGYTSENTYMLLYYILFMSLDFFSFISASIIIKKNIKSVFLKQTIVNIVICAFMGLFVYGIFDSFESRIIVDFIFFTVLVLLSVIFLDLSPILYFFMITIGLTCLGAKVVILQVPINMLNIYFFGVVIIFVCFFKQYVTVRNLRQEAQILAQQKQLEAQNEELERQKNLLLNNKELLEAEVLEQTESIHRRDDQIIKMQDSTIIALSNLIENRDEDTGNHVSRTSRYVNMLTKRALEVNLYTDTINEKFLENIRKAAPLHDMGKIVVSDMILRKPGKLTEEEFKDMQRHTIEGGRIVKEILSDIEDTEYIEMASEVALYHHEKFNGTGYPYNLKGCAIPVSARIMAIADVFDALVSKRCYKEPFSLDEALQIIREESGKHFDPFLAEAFLSLKDELRECLNNDRL